MFCQIKKTKWRGTSKKITAFLLILMLSFSFLPRIALAGLVPSPSTAANEGTDAMMNKFGINPAAIAETASNLNVLNNKKQNPQVMVTFTPTNPDPGEKVTATAEPMYFGNKGENLYYTWYLKHRGEADTVDNLEKVFKVRASRIIANGGFDWQKAANNGAYAGDGNPDNDSYRAIFGGNDQSGKSNHCFFYDVNKGSEYEFQNCGHLFPYDYFNSDFDIRRDDNGDKIRVGTKESAFGNREEEFWTTDPNNPDTAGKGHSDAANVVGLGSKAFTWTYQEGDQVGVAIEGTSYEPTAYPDSSFKIMWALSKNKCDLTDDALSDPSDKKAKEFITIDPPQWPDCPDGCQFTRTIKTREKEFSQAPSSSYQIATSKIKTITQLIQLNSRKTSTGTAEGGSGGSGGENPAGGSGGSVGLGSKICPFSPPEEASCYSTDGVPESQQNGTATVLDTDGKPLPKFSDLSCCPSDEPEVSQGEDGCPVTPKRCAVISSTETAPESTSPGYSMSPTNNGDGNLFQMTTDDLNKCLLQNFVDPTDTNGGGGGGGADKKLEVSLSYSPKNPINIPLPTGNNPDTFAMNADEISVDSNINNAKDPEFLNYTWEVYRGDSPSSEEGTWTLLTKDKLDGSGQSIGMGLKSFKFNMRFDEIGGKYLKVKLAVSENAYNGTRTGNSDVVIPISSNQDTLNVYSVAASDDANLTLASVSQKCITNGQSDPICEVAKNQILAVQAVVSGLSNLIWTMDGQPINNYNGANGPTNPTFFPVTKEVGDTFSVSLAATDNTGKKINLSRAFKVIDPKITITSNDKTTCTPVLKGFYIDNNNVSWPDYSENEFETLTGATLSLKANFTGATPPENQITWYVDNVLAGKGSSLAYAATKPVGDSYSIAVSGLYSQDNATARALSKYWGISYNGLYEKNSSATINVKTVGNLADTTAKGNVKKFLAALATGVPSYLSFLFRIILTTALMLFTYRVIFILLPNARREEI